MRIKVSSSRVATIRDALESVARTIDGAAYRRAATRHTIVEVVCFDAIASARIA